MKRMSNHHRHRKHERNPKGNKKQSTIPAASRQSVTANDSDQPESNEIAEENSNKEKPTMNWRTNPDWWMVILTAVVAVFAGASVWIFYLQLGEMHASLVKTQRAWGQVTDKDSTPKTLADISEVIFPMQVTNVGNNPAKRVRVNAVVEILKHDEPPSFNYSLRHNSVMTAVLFPKGSYDIEAALFRPDKSIAKLTDTERQELKDGLTYFAIYGEVIYVDGFGPHWTHFCGWKSFAIGYFHAAKCIDYNDTDE